MGRIVWMNGLLLALGLTVAVFLTTKPTDHDGGFDSDGLVYARMATAPLFAESGDIPPPWSYRVLTPKLASLVPGPLLDRFRAIAFMANLRPFFGAFVGADMLHQGWLRDMRRASLFAAAATVVPLVALTAVRAQFTARTAGVAQVLLQETWRSLHPPFWPVFAHAMFSGLGVLPVLLLARCRPWLALLRRRPALVVYLVIAVACLFGGIDKSRLFLYALPVLTCLSLASMASLEEDLGSRFPVWAMLFLSCHWYLGNYLTPLGGNSVRARTAPCVDP